MDSTDRFLNAVRDGSVSLPHGVRPFVIDGEPVVIAGRDALVLRLRDRSGQPLALRVPADDDGGADWFQRYPALAETYAAGPLAARLPSRMAVTAGVLRDAQLPAITMEWIEGPTLLQAVHRACLARNATVLGALATAFRDAVNDLREAGFRHGDLTADNIIIRSSGRLAFVDLDSAVWPGSPVGSTGRGTPGYRHPTGNASSETARDAFSALTIYTSLRLLAAYPELRVRFGDAPDVAGGSLLFSAWDLADPVSSRLFAELERTEATRGPELDALRSVCLDAPDSASSRAFVIPGLQPYRNVDEAQPAPRRWGAPAAPRRDSMLTGFRERLRAGVLEDREETREHTTLERQDTPAPWPVGPSWPTPVAQPAERPRPTASQIGASMWRDRLRRAIELEDESAVARLWPEVAHDPLAHTMALDVAAVLGRGLDRRIGEEARRGRDDTVVSMVGEAAQQGVTLSPESRRQARAARTRIATRTELEQALSADDRDRLADLAISGRLVELGDADRVAIRTVLRALERPILDRALASDDDVLILMAFDEELFGSSDALTFEERERIALARDRAAWLRDVKVALKRRDAGFLAAAFAKPPPGAEARLSESARRRAYRLIERDRALDALTAAIAKQDEAAVLVALNTVERVGARIANRVDWPTLKHVVDRATLIEEIQTAASATPPDHARLAHLLPSARALGLDNDPRLKDIDLAAIQRQVVRAAHVRRLRSALMRDDDTVIAMAATPDPYEAVAALTSEERVRVERAIATRRTRLPFST